MKSFAAIIAALGFVATANAETAVKTEYFHQAAAEKNEGTVALDYSDSSTESKANSRHADFKKTLTPITLRYERGLTEEWSVGAALPYMLSGSGDLSGSVAGDKYDIKGMGDLVVYMRGQHGIQSNMSVHYGLDLSYSLGKAKRNGTSVGSDGTKDATFQSGGMGLMPYVGMAYAMDAHIFGAKLSTEIALGDTKRTDETTNASTTTTAENTLTGGHTTKLAAFYETAAMGAVLGAELSYSGTSTIKAN